MASYQVRGLTPLGRLETREFQAGGGDEAARLARQAGLEVLDVRSAALTWPVRQTRASFGLALFARELIALLRAGLSLIEALETLQERQQDAQRDGAVLSELIARMREGKSFSQGLQDFPEYFPELFVASIAASEQTGEMVDAMERYLRYHEQVSFIRQKLVSASLYPAMLLLVGLAVALFLLCFLVPRFSHVYEGLDHELPLASRWLLQWGMLVSEHTLLVVLAMGALVAGVFMLFQQPALQQRLLAGLQHNRWLGRPMRLMQLSRFYRSLGLLLRGGIPALKAMRMTQPLLPLAMQTALGKAIQSVSQGRPLSLSLQEVQLTTPVAFRLLRAGERNGQVADMLEQVASFHDKEVAQWIDRFAKLFEPLLMLLIGGVIGGIVVLLYLPIFELAGSLQ